MSYPCEDCWRGTKTGICPGCFAELEAKAAKVPTLEQLNADLNQYIFAFAEAWVDWHKNTDVMVSDEVIEAATALVDCVYGQDFHLKERE